MMTSLAVPFQPEALALAVGSLPVPSLLESDGGAGRGGRFSILAAEPREVFETTDEYCSIIRPGEMRIRLADPFAALDHWLADWRLDSASPGEREGKGRPLTFEPDGPPFQGGAIGYLGYDLAPHLERLPRKADRDVMLPDMRFAVYDWAIVIDHWKREARLWCFDLHETRERNRIERRLKRIWARISEVIDASAPSPSPGRLGPLVPDFTRDHYLQAVEQALERIRAGDIFQVNFAQRFTARGEPDPLGLYERLKRISPSPFAAFLNWDDQAVISASPEWFFEMRDGRIVTRPIKGTRPRGATPSEDDRLIRELLDSAKDRAELTMIVDLERNDLGRVCEYGSVRVTEAARIESFAQVHHLVATIEGELRPGTGWVDVIRAIFPGGSITGAPKIRAMEIIDELEPCRRGAYTGAIGYITKGGASMFNIAIRTLVIDGDRASYHVGGGIVADSDPASEYEETLHKGRGLRQVLEAAGEPD